MTSRGATVSGHRFRVLGGGLAGLATAITLARRGHAVVVLERRSQCGSRFHGDLQCIESWSSEHDTLQQLRQQGLVPDGAWVKPMTRATLVAPSGRLHRISSRRPAGYIVRRGIQPESLDTALKDEALALGVEIQFDATARPEDCHVVATGPRHPTGFVVGAKIEAATDEDRCVMWVGHPAVPHGYFYLVSSGGQGVVAATVLSSGTGPRPCLRSALAAMESLMPGFVRRCGPQFGGYGQFGLRPDYVQHGALWVGECAGLQDALWGFGINAALTSGWLAGRALDEGVDYNTLLEQHLLPWVRGSLVNRWLLERGGSSAISGVLAAWSIHQGVRGDGLPFIRRLYRPKWLRSRLLDRARADLLLPGDEGIECIHLRRR
ncbi:MAG: NAD(P)-binding protein [Polyangiaceae bacterium]|nr:NAD(P)-binding protein [Polyangiaceae bacterium]MCB9649379.1 NAD(P)-binding protein [Deltaproteobacteria bacterium]